MKNVERRDRQLPYISDAEVMEQQMNARRLTQKLNRILEEEFREDGIFLRARTKKKYASMVEAFQVRA